MCTEDSAQEKAIIYACVACASWCRGLSLLLFYAVFACLCVVLGLSILASRPLKSCKACVFEMRVLGRSTRSSFALVFHSLSLSLVRFTVHALPLLLFAVREKKARGITSRWTPTWKQPGLSRLDWLDSLRILNELHASLSRRNETTPWNRGKLAKQKEIGNHKVTPVTTAARQTRQFTAVRFLPVGFVGSVRRMSPRWR